MSIALDPPGIRSVIEMCLTSDSETTFFPYPYLAGSEMRCHRTHDPQHKDGAIEYEVF
jgi:hypothetical protein